MALKAFLKSLDGLPADVAKEYVKDGDGYKLSVEKVGTLELADTQGLLSALEKERERANQATQTLGQFEGVDPKKARDALKIAESLSGMSLDQKVEASVKAREAQLIQKHDETVKTLSETLTKREKSLHRILITQSATEAIAAEGGIPTLLLPIVERSMRIKPKGDDFEAEVFDPASGVTRLSGTQGGQAVPMTPRDYVASLKANPDLAGAFRSTSKSGSGSTGTSTPANHGADLSQLDPVSRLRAARASAQN